MKNAVIALILILFAFGSPVLASNWMQIGDKDYIDLDSVKYSDGFSYYWAKYLNDGSNTFKNINKDIWFVLMYQIINCDNRTEANSIISAYNLKGDNLGELKEPNLRFDLFTPDSPVDKAFNYVCNQDKKRE